MLNKFLIFAVVSFLNINAQYKLHFDIFTDYGDVCKKIDRVFIIDENLPFCIVDAWDHQVVGMITHVTQHTVDLVIFGYVYKDQSYHLADTFSVPIMWGESIEKNLQNYLGSNKVKAVLFAEKAQD